MRRWIDNNAASEHSSLSSPARAKGSRRDPCTGEREQGIESCRQAQKDDRGADVATESGAHLFETEYWVACLSYAAQMGLRRSLGLSMS